MPRSFRILAIGCLLLAPVVAQGAAPVNRWINSYGSTGDDWPADVACDALGNVYVTGTFTGTINFGTGNLVSASAGRDGFIAKFDPNGLNQWSKRFGDIYHDIGISLAIDPSGNVILAGQVGGTVNLGGANLVGAVQDIVLAKYNSAGVHQWSQIFSSPSPEWGYINTDASGNILMTGTFGGSLSFGGATLVSAGGSGDVFVAKYNPAGLHQWSQRFGGTDEDEGLGIAADANGNVIVGGFFNGSASLGGATFVSAGLYDGFIAKYTAAGSHVWSKRFGSTDYDAAVDVACDGTNNVIMAGWFNGTVNVGGSNLTSAGSYDNVFAKYNAGGTHVWSIRQGGASDEGVTGIELAPNGDILTSGIFQGSSAFGNTTLVSAGNYDGYIGTISPAGVPKWALRFGGPGQDDVSRVAPNGQGDLCVVGDLFGASATFDNIVLSGNGGWDIHVSRWSVASGEPLITSISDVGNDQGRKVMIRFEASGADNPAAFDPTTHYVALRRNDPPPAASSTEAPQPAARADGWVEVSSVGAFANNAYLIEAPTIGDSTLALGQYLSVFKIRASSDTPSLYFDSPPDSGYSKDNLAPGAPQNLVFTSGDLDWNDSGVEDFDFFTVYGSNTDSFGSATLVDYTVTSTLDVSASPYPYYFVSATDFSGNEGKPAKVNSLSGAGGTPGSYVLSVSNFPNPFNPHTTVKYTVPLRGHVSVGVFDARGAFVASLFDGERAAGAYEMDWDGRTQAGGVAASGIYFARIEHNGATRTKKMVLLK